MTWSYSVGYFADGRSIFQDVDVGVTDPIGRCGVFTQRLPNDDMIAMQFREVRWGPLLPHKHILSLHACFSKSSSIPFFIQLLRSQRFKPFE